MGFDSITIAPDKEFFDGALGARRNGSDRVLIIIVCGITFALMGLVPQDAAAKTYPRPQIVRGILTVRNDP